MTGWDLTRRQALHGAGLLGLSALTAGFPIWSARAADLKIGFICIGPRDDWGWNQAFAEAVHNVSALAGVEIVEAGYLPESTDYSSGKASRQTDAYADELERLVGPDGANLIVSTSFGYDPFLFAVAVKNPTVAFRHAAVAASDRAPENVGGVNALINQGHYVNGVAAGLCTKTGKLGFIAGEPESAVLVNVNSFLIGCRRSNPDATVHVVFTGGWENADIESAATKKLVRAGCDVITCHLDSPKLVIETAEGLGAKTCGHAYDQSPLAPKGFITGAEFAWTPMFKMFAEMILQGKTLPAFVIGGYDKGYVESSPFGAGANPKAVKAGKSAIRDMRDGMPIFVGPIKDNTGTLVVPAGTTYGPYAPELFKTDYLVEGVVGSIK